MILKMPKMSGVQFLRELQALPGQTRPVVLVLTGWGAAHVRESYEELGVFDTLIKPCSIERLLDRVNAAVQARTAAAGVS